MTTFTQEGRPISIATPLGKDVLLLEKFSGSEAVSRPFHFRLELLADLQTLQRLVESGQAKVFNQLMGQAVTVTLTVSGVTRWFHGIVSRLEQGGRVFPSEKSCLVRFEADLVPSLWLLKHRRQWRVFQDLSGPAIVLQILKNEWNLNVTGLEALASQRPARPLCIQCRESDFDFVSRLLEEEGLSYFFVHGDGAHQMVVSDGLTNPSSIPAPATVAFDDEKNVEGRVIAFAKNAEVCPNLVTLRDQNFELAGSGGPVFRGLQESWSVTSNVQAGSVAHDLHHPVKGADGVDRLELYDYPGRHAKRFDGISREGAETDVSERTQDEGKRLARIGMEALAAQAVTVSGASTCAGFLPGHQFTLQRHFLDANGPYLLTEVEHSASIAGVYRSGMSELPRDFYENRFRGIPCDPALPYRPVAATPRPRIEGAQTAVVVGPKDSEIHVDKYGRVRVQFHWDRPGVQFAGDSCWVRVAQLWAGKNWGAFFWPRVGQEVVVNFLDGDPDRPIVVGSVYSAANPPPVELPKEATLAGIKSRIFNSDAPQMFNAIIIFDTPGVEYVHVASRRNEMRHCQANHYQRVPRGNFAFHGDF